MLKHKLGWMMMVAACAASVCGIATAVDDARIAVTPTPADCDFCAIMNNINAVITDNGPSGLGWLVSLLGEEAALLENIVCDRADLNGGLDEEDLPVGNGMLDGEYELEVIFELINNVSKYSNLKTGTVGGQIRAGVDPQAVLNALLAPLVPTSCTNVSSSTTTCTQGNFLNLYSQTMHNYVKQGGLISSVWTILQSQLGPEIKPRGTQVGDTVTVNGITFTAGTATTVSTRTFKVTGGSQDADNKTAATELKKCIASTTYGVTNIKSADADGKVRLYLNSNYPDVTTITITSSNADRIQINWDGKVLVPNLTDELGATLAQLFPDLMLILAGYITIGDGPAIDTVMKLAELLTLCDLISEGSCLIPDVISDPNRYVKFPQFLASEGDADGDGYSNRDEYEAFAGVKSSTSYINAVLNPAITPSGSVEGEGEGEGEGGVEGTVSTYPNGLYRVPEGGMLYIFASTDLTGTVTYQWLFEGEELLGQTDKTLVIRDLTYDQSGQYRCRASNDAKATVLSPPVTVVVVDPSTVPLAGGLGLGALAGLCALGGALVIRRKK